MMVKQRENSRHIPAPYQERISKGKVCPVCEKPKTEWSRRTDWTCCSKECTKKLWNEIASPDWSALRLKVFERDNFQCVKCGLIPEKEIWKLQYGQTPEKYFKERMQRSITFLKFETRQYNGKDELVSIHKDPSKLIGDHIVPIACGGGQWDINNIQTLCEECDKIKTAQDIKEIAKLRVIEKNQAKGQQQLNEVVDCSTQHC